MIRLCELTGLSQADLTEITFFVLGIHIAGAFFWTALFWTALFWTAKEILILCEKLIDFGTGRFFRHIRKGGTDEGRGGGKL